MPRNETKRVRVKLFYAHLQPPHSYDNAEEIWLVQETTHDTWSVLTTAAGTPCGLQQPYSLIGSLCSTRALDAEDGLLLVHGQRVTAEQYLKRWRQAPVLTASELAEQGFSIEWITHRPSVAMRAELERSCDDEEHLALRQLLLAHPDMTDDGVQMSWRLDLLTEAGMRAYLALRRVHHRGSEADPVVAPTTLAVKRRFAALTHLQSTPPAAPASAQLTFSL